MLNMAASMKAGIPRVGSSVGGPILFGYISHWGFLREMQQCWRRSALEKINLDEICSNGYVFQVEMCYVAEELNLRMLEVPIYFEDRHVGKSKMTGLVKIEAAFRVFEIRWRNRQSVSIHRIRHPYNNKELRQKTTTGNESLDRHLHSMHNSGNGQPVVIGLATGSDEADWPIVSNMSSNALSFDEDKNRK